MLAAESGPQPSFVILIVVLFTGSTLIAIGYAKAVMDRANSDYKKTKAGLPAMRKAFWQAWWRTVKISFWMVIVGVVLVVWVVNDVRDAGADPQPSPSVSTR